MVQSMQGIRIGRYQLGRRIGAGGMGQVYLAEDTHLLIGRQIAIKVTPCPPSEEDADIVIELFKREVKGITTLNHPHILPLFDYDITQFYTTKFAYLVMPYCEEGSLDKWRREHSLSSQDVARFIFQAASALQCAHDLAQPIIHKDVKPSNFLLRKNMEHPERPDLLLADFGVAKLSTATFSMGNFMLGTPPYMAPEQWDGSPVPATDQYGLAIMAYELLTGGRRPFESNNRDELRKMHVTVQAEPPGTFNPSIPKALDDVILRALTKNPENRYQSISAFAEAFKQAAYSEEKGDDIHLLLTLSETEALAGTTLPLSLPQGEIDSISIPAGTRNGEQLSLAGKGAPSGFGGPAGTLIVTILTRPDTPDKQIVTQQLQPVTQRLDKIEASISTVADKLEVSISTAAARRVHIATILDAVIADMLPGFYLKPATPDPHRIRRRTIFSTVFSIMIVGALILGIHLGTPPPPPPSKYLHETLITIQPTKVSDGPYLSNFPVLISLKDQQLKTAANGGYVQNSHGYDIIFKDRTETILDHEIETYVPTTGEIKMWVRIPKLLAAQDTMIYMYFDNSSVINSQENKTEVWDSNYLMVQHFSLGTTLSASDSTSNGNNGTISNATATSGQIDGGVSFNGSDALITEPNSLVQNNTIITLSTWFRTSTSGIIVGYQNAIYPSNPSQFVPILYVGTDRKLRGEFWIGSPKPITSSGTVTDGNWHYAVLVGNTNTQSLYLDGALINSLPGTINNLDQSYNQFGGGYWNNFWPSFSLSSGWSIFNGSLDELRISNTARSSGWIMTEYKNQSSPCTFYTTFPSLACM